MDCSLVMVVGELAKEPELRTLESGSVLAVLTLRVKPDDDRRAMSLPVTMWDPPPWVAELHSGTRVVVSGRVVRRFYALAGGRASRVEVVAEHIANAGDRRARAKVRRAVEQVLDSVA